MSKAPVKTLEELLHEEFAARLKFRKAEAKLMLEQAYVSECNRAWEKCRDATQARYQEMREEWEAQHQQ